MAKRKINDSGLEITGANSNGNRTTFTYGASSGITSGANSIIEAFKNAVNKNVTAAETANKISEESQKTAMNFNSGMAALANNLNSAYLGSQQAYNTNAAAQANALNQAMWQQTADYNSAQAAANREWQEHMSSTAYQRAVKDLRAAGLNPVLAAFNGGASVGSGATGSTAAMQSHAANSGLQSAESASVGLYSGILENTSNTLALAAAVVEGFGALADSIKGDKTQQSVIDWLLDPKNNATAAAGNDLAKGLGNLGNGIADWLQEFITGIKNPYGGGGKSRGQNSHSR